mmetsp:Transcript_47888/g.102659  ORF Transcript_47888/g.102659 Transcript_47888/m.102659 type:complete len:201 (-) Transcript_47888:471-1073(-)
MALRDIPAAGSHSCAALRRARGPRGPLGHLALVLKTTLLATGMRLVQGLASVTAAFEHAVLPGLDLYSAAPERLAPAGGTALRPIRPFAEGAVGRRQHKFNRAPRCLIQGVITAAATMGGRGKDRAATELLVFAWVASGPIIPFVHYARRAHSAMLGVTRSGLPSCFTLAIPSSDATRLSAILRLLDNAAHPNPPTCATG